MFATNASVQRSEIQTFPSNWPHIVIFTGPSYGCVITSKTKQYNLFWTYFCLKTKSFCRFGLSHSKRFWSCVRHVCKDVYFRMIHAALTFDVVTFSQCKVVCSKRFSSSYQCKQNAFVLVVTWLEADSWSRRREVVFELDSFFQSFDTNAINVK